MPSLYWKKMKKINVLQSSLAWRVGRAVWLQLSEMRNNCQILGVAKPNFKVKPLLVYRALCA